MQSMSNLPHVVGTEIIVSYEYLDFINYLEQQLWHVVKDARSRYKILRKQYGGITPDFPIRPVFWQIVKR